MQGRNVSFEQYGPIRKEWFLRAAGQALESQMEVETLDSYLAGAYEGWLDLFTEKSFSVVEKKEVKRPVSSERPTSNTDPNVLKQLNALQGRRNRRKSSVTQRPASTGSSSSNSTRPLSQDSTIVSSPATSVASNRVSADTNQETVVAKYACESQGEGYLKMNAGDRIVVTNKASDAWWYGYNMDDFTQKNGYFPVNHIESQQQQQAVAPQVVEPVVQQPVVVTPVQQEPVVVPPPPPQPPVDSKAQQQEAMKQQEQQRLDAAATTENLFAQGTWTAHFDAASEKFYYYNTVTGQSQYDSPIDTARKALQQAEQARQQAEQARQAQIKADQENAEALNKIAEQKAKDDAECADKLKWLTDKAAEENLEVPNFTVTLRGSQFVYTNTETGIEQDQCPIEQAKFKRDRKARQDKLKEEQDARKEKALQDAQKREAKAAMMAKFNDIRKANEAEADDDCDDEDGW
jgi:hypothetical protein